MPDKQLHNNIPALRFPEFKNDGEWEEDTVENLFDFITNNTLSRAELNYENGSYLNVHYGDVLIKFCECLDVKRESLPHISEDKIAQKFCNSILKNGDIVIADTAEDETVGKCTEIVNLTDEFVVPGLHTIAIRPKREFASRYLGFYMNSQSFRNQLSKLMQGVKVLSISKSALRNTIVKFPLSKGEHCKEQNKIAEFLFSLDELLSATKSKLEQLKAYKKGLMQKLFPARGKKLPELRFKEFEKDGEWEEKKFGEIISVNSGRDYKHLNYGNIPVYGTGGYMLSVDDKLSDIDAVGIGRKGTIDKPQYLKAPFWTVDTLFFLTSLNGYDIQFIYYLTQTVPWKKYGEQTGVPSLSKLSIENLNVVVPPSAFEQRKIVQILLPLEEELESLSQKIVLLENQKKGLMQQLFVY